MKDNTNVSNYVVSVQINLTAEQVSSAWRELKPLIPVLISWAILGVFLLPSMPTVFDNAHSVPPHVERAD